MAATLNLPETFNHSFPVVPDAVVHIYTCAHVVRNNAEALANSERIPEVRDIQMAVLLRHTFKYDLRMFGNIAEALFTAGEQPIA